MFILNRDGETGAKAAADVCNYKITVSQTDIAKVFLF